MSSKPLQEDDNHAGPGKKKWQQRIQSVSGSSANAEPTFG